jgi:hypothetical protein
MRKQHFIDDGFVAGMTVSFCDFNLFRELGLQIILAVVGVGQKKPFVHVDFQSSSPPL